MPDLAVLGGEPDESEGVGAGVANLHGNGSGEVFRSGRNREAAGCGGMAPKAADVVAEYSPGLTKGCGEIQFCAIDRQIAGNSEVVVEDRGPDVDGVVHRD